MNSDRLSTPTELPAISSRREGEHAWGHAAARELIPRRLHFVWVGSKLPDKQRAFIETWRETNPSYEIVAWSEDNIDLTIPAIATAYSRKRWATVADIVRLIAVYEHGGIYFDTDFRLYRPLDRLLTHRCFFSFQHESHATDWVCNGVFGAIPRHPFIGIALKTLLRLRPSPLGLDRPTKYGPKLLTRLLRQAGLRDYAPHGVHLQDMFICPTTYFFPFSYGETFHEDCLTADTLAAHFWAKSWEQDVPAFIRFAKSLRQKLPARRPI